MDGMDGTFFTLVPKLHSFEVYISMCIQVFVCLCYKYNMQSLIALPTEIYSRLYEELTVHNKQVVYSGKKDGTNRALILNSNNQMISQEDGRQVIPMSCAAQGKPLTSFGQQILQQGSFKWQYDQYGNVSGYKMPDGTVVKDQRICAVCNKVDAKLCTGCRVVSYCSRECQRADWASHKRSCTGR